MFEDLLEKLKEKNQGKIPLQDQFNALRELAGKVTEEKKMGADLLFMVTYMDSLALSQATRPEIFTYGAERKEYVSSKYIKKVDTFVKRWNYSYAEALSIVAERTKNEILQNLLNRYSNSIDSGVPDEDFLNTELFQIRSVYRSQLEQGFELLKKWGDAYIAMLLSGTVIAVTIMISVAIYSPEGIEGTLNLAYAIILVISVFGVTLMYRSVPYDEKTHGLRTWRSREQMTIMRMERVIVPGAVAAALILVIAGANMGFAYVIFGVLVLPLGIIGFIDDTNITRRDADFSMFIRSFGAVMGGQGTTSVYALAKVDRKSLSYLEPLINAVYSKLNLGLEETTVWDRFIGESGSNLIYKYLNIFRDTVTLGGPPEPIGKIVGESMLEQVLLREKKNMLARSFIALLIPMHVAMAAIFVALFEIMVILTESVGTMMKQFQTVAAQTSGAAGSAGASIGGIMGAGMMSMFVNFPKDAMNTYVVIILTIITGSNVLAAKIVGGGDRYMYYFYIAIFCILTGIVFIVVPIAVKVFFSPQALVGAGSGLSAIPGGG
jgi:flagellar protein FlaJ